MRRRGVATTARYPLPDRFRLEEGTVFLSGVQALARIPGDQLRIDRRLGLTTAAFASGYQGSPVGTFTEELRRAAATARMRERLSAAGALDMIASDFESAVFLMRPEGADPELLARLNLVAKLPEPEEVAETIAWLASDDASTLNGVALPMDYGTIAG